MNIRTLIIDDYRHARDTLANLLASNHPTINLVGAADGVVAGTKLVLTQKPDLIFLDIELGDGTGFDLLELLPTRNFHVIFTTGYDAFALKAFRVSAIDYLLKPIDPDELAAAVDKLPGNTEVYQANRFEMLLDQVKRQSIDRIALPTIDGLIMVDVNDILRCEADSNYTHIHLVSAGKHTIPRTLKEYDELLPDHLFYRIHQSHLVNLSHLDKYTRGDGGSVLMSDGSDLPVSRHKKAGLLERLGV